MERVGNRLCHRRHSCAHLDWGSQIDGAYGVRAGLLSVRFHRFQHEGADGALWVQELWNLGGEVRGVPEQIRLPLPSDDFSIAEDAELNFLGLYDSLELRLRERPER